MNKLLATNILYNPTIDGLRAISVLSVLLFHFFPKILPSGYLGVDVFFVISGYLITNIILNQCSQSGFSYKIFYSRRINRIFPSLIIVIGSTLMLGFFFLFPTDYESLAKHAIGGTLFTSNFLLFSEVGYFDKLAETKPLLHLWSLSIEEQGSVRKTVSKQSRHSDESKDMSYADTHGNNKSRDQDTRVSQGHRII